MTAARPLRARLAALPLVAVLVLLLGGMPLPAAYAQSGDALAGLSAQFQAEERKIAAHEQHQADLQTQIDAHEDKAADHDEKANALQEQTAAHEEKVESLSERISAHNAQPHEFVLPQQAGAAAAYDAEASELNSEKAQLDAESAQLQNEQTQLNNEGTQLDAEEQQQRAEVAALTQEAAQLAAECTQLLERAATALDSAATAPENTAPRTIDQAPGGDQGRPPPVVGHPRQIAGDGGDPVSRRGTEEALDAYGKATGVTVNKQPVWSRLTADSVPKIPADARTRLNLTRTYDGLVRKPNGHYRALTVPSATTGITPGQKGFDDAIKAGGQAKATLNGQDIVIDEVVTVPGKPVTAPATDCGANCRLVSGGTPTTATVSPRKLLDDAKALHDTVSPYRDRFVSVATGQLGGRLVYAVNNNGAPVAMQQLAEQLHYERVWPTDLDRDVETDAEQIIYNRIEEGDYVADGIIAASRPACGPDQRGSGRPGQDCAGRAVSFPNIQLWDQPRNR
jgi:peptidoglycan hydrolase CwlO-like protein